MKKRRFIGWLVGATLMASMSNCSDDLDSIAPEEVVNPAMQKYSTILLNVAPGSPSLTRADVGEVSPLDIGERIYSIKVWAFLSAGQTPRNVSYSSINMETGTATTMSKTTQTPDDLQMANFVNSPIAYVEYENATGTVEYQQLQLSIPSVVLENFWKLDIYATCNSQSYVAKTTDNPTGEVTSHATRQQIEAAIIKHDEGQEDADRKDPFGVINPIRGSQSFEAFKGIPMSYIQKNIDFYNEQTNESNIIYDYLENRYDFNRDYVQDIHLQHIVSKFHFVFTRSIGTVTEAEITKIELGLLNSDGDVIGGAFPTVEYQMPKMDIDNPNVMATRATNIGTDYENAIITFEGESGAALFSTADIMETQDVYQYMATVDGDGKLYVNGVQMTAQQYDDLLSGASYDVESASSTTEGKELTMFGRTWVRETDKQLGGKIYYKINGEVKTTTFQMAEAGDFSRNHLWIIYAYFEGEGLYVKPNVLPWQAEDEFEIATGVNCEVNVTQEEHPYKVYTETSGAMAGDYIGVMATEYYLKSDDGGVTYNYIPDDAEGYKTISKELPTGTPLLKMTYSSGRALRMSRTSESFVFVWARALADGSVPAYNATVEVGEGISAVIEPAWRVSKNIRFDGKGTFYFYVVPTEQFSLDNATLNRFCSVLVTETSGSSQLPTGRVPYNTEDRSDREQLPGELTEVNIYYTTPSQYESLRYND